jgi:hypothetical protein
MTESDRTGEADRPFDRWKTPLTDAPTRPIANVYGPQSP